MNKKDKMAENLLEGQTIESYREGGNSMEPIIKHRQPVTISPIKLEDVEVGHVVFCKVSGRYWMHKVHAIDPKKGLQIGNNKGHINGWTKNVFGRITSVDGKDLK